MFQRLLVAYGFFTMGLIGICIGMNTNGSATPRNPVWLAISILRTICVLTWAVPIAIAALVFAAHWLSTVMAAKVDAEKEAEKEAARRHQQLLAVAQKRRLELVAERQENAKEEEQTRLHQEQLKKQIEEQRRKRTAEEVTQSALNDFL